MLCIEQQRMAALRAHVFMAAVAIREFFVIVLAEKTLQRVADTGDRAILGEVIRAASALAFVTGRLLEDVVVDVMPPKEAREPGELDVHNTPYIPECAKRQESGSRVRRGGGGQVGYSGPL